MLRVTISRHSGEKNYLRKFCLIIISLTLVSIHIQAQNGWTQKADIPTPRVAASASVVNGKIYVIGGWDANINELANNEMYDPLTGSWEIKAPLPTPRGCLLTAVVNDSIYAIGGGYSSYKLKVEVYDPVTNTWTQKNDMPSGRIGQNAAIVDGIIYVEGGNYNSRECWAYNPSTDTWTRKQDIPLPGGGNSSLTVYNGLIYAIGGSTYQPWNALPYVFAYNPQTDTWTQKQSMPEASFGLQTYLVDGLIYAVGGGQSDNIAKATVQVYYPEDDRWATCPHMPMQLTWFAGAFVYDTIYVFGGVPMGWGTVESKVWACYKTALPVELTSFTGNVVDGEVLLKWSTSTETNNKGFEIYRNGKKISFIDGKGTTTEKHDYSFLDAKLSAGLYNYRLNQIDFDGTQKVVGEVTVNLIIPEQFSLEQNYPNPFNPTTVISYHLAVGSQVVLKVYDVLGNEVATLVNEEKPNGIYKVEFDASGLSSGIYFYTLKAGKYVESKKLILMK